MKLAQATWPEIEALDRRSVVVIPTGSMEQHGPHLPLATDTRLVTAVAEAVESARGADVLLTPTVWLGASGHHLGFAGTLSASFSGYVEALINIAESLAGHGFTKFLFLNGHGGNTSPNAVAARTLKERQPNRTVVSIGYFELLARPLPHLRGPTLTMRHACEAETSLMLHLHPDEVRFERAVNDGLDPEPAIPGIVHRFDEISETGVVGHPTFATAETGARIFADAVAATGQLVDALVAGYQLLGIE